MNALAIVQTFLFAPSGAGWECFYSALVRRVPFHKMLVLGLMAAVLWPTAANVSAAQSNLAAEGRSRPEAYADMEIYYFPAPFYAKYKLREEQVAVETELREEVRCGDEYTVLSAGHDWTFVAYGAAECERGRQLLAQQIRRTSHTDAGGASDIPEALSRAIDSVGEANNGLVDPNWHFQSNRNQPRVQERQSEVRLDDWTPGAELSIDSTRWQGGLVKEASNPPFGADGVLVDLAAMDSLWKAIFVVAAGLGGFFFAVWLALYSIWRLVTFGVRQILRR